MIETHRFPTTDITSKELDRPGFFWFEGEPIALVKKRLFSAITATF